MSLIEKYKKEAVPKMIEKFGYKSPAAVPKIKKVVVNTGFGRLLAGKTPNEQKKIREAIMRDLSLICGQAPVLTLARKSIAGFKIREGLPIGAKATLRGKRMYGFLERLISAALPRSRDFRGISPDSLDEKGNLTIPVKEHIIFPEISPEDSAGIFGLEATITTTAKTKEEGLEMLKLMGFPIKPDEGARGRAENYGEKITD